jgi:osmotically-inducible protein OsmY
MLLAVPSIEFMALKYERRWPNDAMQVAAACVVSLAFALPACRASDEENAMAQAKKPIGAGDAGKANAKLEAAVKAKLDADAQLKAAQLSVSADVTRNAVTLAGSVSSEELRRRAVELAREAQAGVLVNDRIVVKPRASSAGPAREKKFYA